MTSRTARQSATAGSPPSAPIGPRLMTRLDGSPPPDPAPCSSGESSSRCSRRTLSARSLSARRSSARWRIVGDAATLCVGLGLGPMAQRVCVRARGELAAGSAVCGLLLVQR
jgi:hypothetical protein